MSETDFRKFTISDEQGVMDVVPASFALDLEQQRDRAVGLLREICDYYCDDYHINGDVIEGDIEKWMIGKARAFLAEIKP